MKIGVVGTKIGMTRVFNENGMSVPVTVIQVTPNRVTQLKTMQQDGYSAVQVTTGVRHAGRVNAALAGHYAKSKVEAGQGLWEFRVDEEERSQYELGAEITVSLFAEVEKVDVTGTSKGKGFQGGVKRHNFSEQDHTHGNSVSHRVLGGTGQNQSPGRVFKGKKMPGQMGNVRVTTQSLELVKVDAENNLLLVKGAIPGAKGGTVLVHKAVK